MSDIQDIPSTPRTTSQAAEATAAMLAAVANCTEDKESKKMLTILQQIAEILGTLDAKTIDAMIANPNELSLCLTNEYEYRANSSDNAAAYVETGYEYMVLEENWSFLQELRSLNHPEDLNCFGYYALQEMLFLLMGRYNAK